MKQAFLHSVFLVLAFCSFGQKPIVILEVEPKEAEVGEMLTITVRANVQGEIDVDLPSGFIHGYEIMNGMKDNNIVKARLPARVSPLVLSKFRIIRNMKFTKIRKLRRVKRVVR